MTRFYTRDADTTLEFDNRDGTLCVYDDDASTFIGITPEAAVNLASALLQYSSQAKTAELVKAKQEASK